MREHRDTRTRIQEIALDLFTEQGYEATSLREIAERLGVTKAALYYHFKTKEDIVASLLEDFLPAVDDLITWLRAQPRTSATRREFIRRYAEALRGSHHAKLMRFLERNQTALRDEAKSEAMRDRMITMLDLLTDPADPLTARVKYSMSLFVLHATWFLLRGTDATDEQRREAALDVAFDLVDSARRDIEERRGPDVRYAASTATGPG